MNSREYVLSLPNAITKMRFVPGVERRETLVFIHGLLGDSQQWRAIDDYHPPAEYADAYYVDFHFELPRPSPLTWNSVIDELLALLHRGPGVDAPVTLIGSSFGGHVALYLASRGLVPASNLVLFGPGGIPEVSRQRGLLKSFRTVNKILDVSFERIFSHPKFARDPAVRGRIEGYQKRIRPHRRDLIRNLIVLSRHMRESTLSIADLRRIRAQTLLVWGRNDHITPPDLCDLFAERIPNSRVAWVDAGHGVHVEAPKESGQILRDFCLGHGEYAEACAALRG